MPCKEQTNLANPGLPVLFPDIRKLLIFYLHSSHRQEVCHILRVSIFILKSDPEMLGCDSASTVEHTCCDTLIHRLIENACWKTRGKKVHCHLEPIYKTTLCLVTKLFPKHVNISLQTTEVIDSVFPLPQDSQKKPCRSPLHNEKTEKTLSALLICYAGNLRRALNSNFAGCTTVHHRKIYLFSLSLQF